MDLIDRIEASRFLGNEFLMWLWYRAECFESKFPLPGGEEIELWFDDKLSLEATLAETERNDFKGGAPAFSPEAKTALRQGKRVTKAKLAVLREGREWSFTLKADSLDMTGVKIPSLLSREEEEQFYERMYLVEEIEDILGNLYERFMLLRLNPVWTTDVLPAIQDWIQRDDQVGPSHYPLEAVEPIVAAIDEPAPEEVPLQEEVLSEDEKAELAAMMEQGDDEQEQQELGAENSDASAEQIEQPTAEAAAE